MGRKDKYKTHIEPYLKKIPKMYETMTEGQIAKKLGVSVASFEKYKNEHPELVECLRKAQASMCDELRGILKTKAHGFYYEETKTREFIGGDEDGTKIVDTFKKYAVPDTGAIHLLLKNNDPEWHNDDKQTMELKKKQVELQERKIELDEF